MATAAGSRAPPLWRDRPPSSREEHPVRPEVGRRPRKSPPGAAWSVRSPPGPDTARSWRPFSLSECCSCHCGHGRYPVPVEVHGEAAGEAGQEGGEGLQGGAGQSEEGPSAEKCRVCPCVCRERHPQEERRCELASDGVPRRRSGLQGGHSCDYEGGDQEYGPGDQSPGQGPEHHGPAEGLLSDGQVRAAGAEPGRPYIGDGGLHELGHHPDHAAGAGGQPHHADRRGEWPGGAGPAQPAARGRLCRGRELCAQPGGPAVTEVGRLEELAVPRRCAPPLPRDVLEGSCPLPTASCLCADPAGLRPAATLRLSPARPAWP
nr:PRSM1 [Homo sapiens]